MLFNLGQWLLSKISIFEKKNHGNIAPSFIPRLRDNKLK